MTTILDFYRGERHPDGFTFAEVLQWPSERWEQCHTAVQWLFPLPEPSQMQPHSPVASSDVYEAFKNDPHLRACLIAAVTRFILFLSDHDWCQPGNHNLLRITRVIRCLVLSGFPDLASMFHEFAEELLLFKQPDARLDKQLRLTLDYWADASSGRYPNS
jgi:hypothetical protein